MPLSRRDFLAAAALPLFASRLVGQETGFPGMIVRAHEPRNLEFPLNTLEKPIVPNERFFVRSHFAVPKIDGAAWKLAVEGAVGKPLSLTLADLVKLPANDLTAIIECAGNGRVHLIPPVPGLQWGQGAVGNAVWRGVRLSTLLDAAGMKDSAVEVILEGADKGQVNNDPKSPGPITFARSLPVAKAKQEEVLLAYKMNGDELPASHGYPLRAVIGGWYGMASVKWLTRIVVTEKPFQGFWQSLDYAYFERRDGVPTLLPLTAMQPKAVIARPTLHDVLPADKPVRLFGAAWAGDRPVEKVEISVDGGKSWKPAKLLDKPARFQWVLWEHVWEKPAKGEAALLARATDDRGATQPEARDADRRTYMINHIVPIHVTVR